MSQKDNFDIYVGGKSGIFKGVGIKREHVMKTSMTDGEEVTCISWGDEDEKQILVGCGSKDIRSVRVYDTDCSAFTCSFYCNIGKGKIVGISRYNDAILAAVQSGEIQLLQSNEKDAFVIKAGESLERMRLSKWDKNIIATGGRDDKLKLFDIMKQKQTFVEKNLSHDSLQLSVPVWISDIEFLPNAKQIVTVGRYGHVRLYDPEAQRRPVINLEIRDEPLTTLSVLSREKQIIVGSGKGVMHLIDLRNPAKVLKKYKGFTSGITGIACSKIEPYVVSVSLDRFLRIHHIDTGKLLKKIYVTTKLSCVLLRSDFSFPVDNAITEENILKHNNKINKVKDENVQAMSGNDPEFDKLFDTMQVIGQGQHNKLKRKRTVTELS